MRRFAALGALALAAAPIFAPACADETWRTELGVMEWDSNVPGAAVLKLTLPDGKFVHFYIEGLRGEDTARGVFSGYYISSQDEAACPAEMTGPDGMRSRRWGRIEMIFLKPAFPSDWVMRSGDCFGELGQHLSGFSESPLAARPPAPPSAPAPVK
jgi:hypothetical protein